MNAVRSARSLLCFDYSVMLEVLSFMPTCKPFVARRKDETISELLRDSQSGSVACKPETAPRED